MADDSTRSGAGAGKPGPRKPYKRPAIIRYGDVRTLTGNGATGSKNDKGSGSKTRTF